MFSYIPEHYENKMLESGIFLFGILFYFLSTLDELNNMVQVLYSMENGVGNIIYII